MSGQTIEAFQNKLRNAPDARKLCPEDFGAANWDFLVEEVLEIRIPELSGLPEGVRFSRVDIRDAYHLTRLPASLASAQHVDLTGCASLTSLPAGLNPEWCRLRGCTSLSHLPDGFNPRYLDLVDCPAKLLPQMPNLTTLELRKGDYRRDISQLSVKEVIFVVPETEEVVTMSKADYMLYHSALPKAQTPSPELQEGVLEVDLV